MISKTVEPILMRLSVVIVIDQITIVLKHCIIIFTRQWNNNFQMDLYLEYQAAARGRAQVRSLNLHSLKFSSFSNQIAIYFNYKSIANQSIISNNKS